MTASVSRFRPLLTGLGLTAATLTTSAHPGHSLHDSTWTHLLTSPDHFAVLAGVGLALVVGAQWVQGRLPRRLVRGSGWIAVLGAALGWVAVS